MVYREVKRRDAALGLFIAAIMVAFVNYGDYPAEVTPNGGNGLENVADSGMVVDGENPLELVQGSEEKQEELPVVEYEISAEERDLIERVVMGEAGGESLLSQKAVAQCILNACLITGERPKSVIEGLQYTSHRPAASEQVKGAVSAIFDEGEKVLAETAIYFYNPDLVVSEWHESQQYICTIEDHRYFARWTS